jgi:hypothetical protein
MNAKAWAAVAPVCTNWKMKVFFEERNEPAPSTSGNLVKPMHGCYQLFSAADPADFTVHMDEVFF